MISMTMACHSKKSIFTNIYEIVANSDYFLYLFLGGRGIGKTYSSLLEAYKNNEVILYVRRTEAELDQCVDEATNPYKAINQQEGLNIHVKANKASVLFVDENDDRLVGMGVALSTMGKRRGVDFSNITMIIYDEFINTSDINTIKNEGFKLFNLIETVNRNRELLGQKSIKVVLLSNANTIDSDIIRTLGLAEEIHKMKKENKHKYTDSERGIYLELLDNKAVRDAKQQTRLYRLTKGTSFYDMALENEFTTDYFGDVKRVDYRELTPLVGCKGLYFYKHKANDLIYVSRRKANCANYTDNTIEGFKRDYGYMIKFYIDNGMVIYNDYSVKLDTFHLLN